MSETEEIWGDNHIHISCWGQKRITLRKKIYLINGEWYYKKKDVDEITEQLLSDCNGENFSLGIQDRYTRNIVNSCIEERLNLTQKKFNCPKCDREILYGIYYGSDKNKKIIGEYNNALEIMNCPMCKEKIILHL